MKQIFSSIMKKVNQDEFIHQNVKIEELETSNRVLLEKLKLLKIQLESQNQLQASAFHHRSAPMHRSQLNLSHRTHINDGNYAKSNETNKMNKQYDTLFQQLHQLQEIKHDMECKISPSKETSFVSHELENVKKQNKNRIQELEEQLKTREPVSPNKLKIELNDNVELIKLKRSTKKLTAQIQSLQSQLEIANSEIKQLQSNLTSITSKNESLQAELSQEKLETTKLLANIETLSDSNKCLEEQLNDLLTEKNTLKEHNENLLKLSLQKESNVGTSDGRVHYLKQIKELEDNLKKEVVAKSETMSRLADAEIQNVKLQNELAKCNAVCTEMKMNNTTLKEQIESLKENVNSIVRTNHVHHSVLTEDKAIMVTITDNVDAVCSRNTPDFPIIIDTSDEIDSNIKMQFYKISNELHQCKELLRVQYTLNNKYKMELEELQKLFQKNENIVSDYSRNLRHILRKHEDRLSQMNDDVETGIESILNDLRDSNNAKKSNQDYILSIDKLLNNYNALVNNLKSNPSSKSSKKDADVSAVIQYIDKIIQTENTPNLIEVPRNEKFLAKGMAMFELHFGKATFSYFSAHLTKSTDNNPKIFLTWNFMDDSENQAYTPTISVNDGQFNCSCQYEGPWSEALHEYLDKHGINVEIHLVQGDISVRLAETCIKTADCIQTPNEYCECIVSFENDNIKGSVSGSYRLNCEIDLLKR